MTDRRASLTRQLAEFTSGTRYAAIPPQVIGEAKRLLLDTIGCALGALETPSGRIAVEYARMTGGHPQATILGLGHPGPATSAAYVNARLANILDADDTFPTSSHFGNSTVFSALAAGEQFGRSGEDLVTAIAVGFDVGARIGNWLGWPVSLENGEVTGWNPLAGPAATVTWAALGSAASIAALDADQTVEAFGIGGANTPLPAMNKFSDMTKVTMLKYADAGWCANVGVSATQLASLGSTGLVDVLDGDFGFWRFYGSDGHDDTALTEGLGTTWQILNTTFKPWPCCRFIHHPLTAFEQIRNEHALRAEEIEQVVVRAMPFSYQAKFLNNHPGDPLSAEFSYAHSLAAVAYDVPAGPQWFTQTTLESPQIRAFREKVSVELEPTSMRGMAESMVGPQFRALPGGVDVHARGTVFRETSSLAKGDPWSPGTRMSDDELVAKFIAMTQGPGESPTGEIDELAHAVISAVDRVEKHEIASLARPLADLASAITRRGGRPPA
jgi:2-methylcitrate dehydratase PrpD